MNGVGRLVGQLQTGDGPLTQSLLRVVCYMAADAAAMQVLICRRFCAHFSCFCVHIALFAVCYAPWHTLWVCLS